MTARAIDGAGDAAREAKCSAEQAGQAVSVVSAFAERAVAVGCGPVMERFGPAWMCQLCRTERWSESRRHRAAANRVRSEAGAADWVCGCGKGRSLSAE